MRKNIYFIIILVISLVSLFYSFETKKVKQSQLNMEQVSLNALNYISAKDSNGVTRNLNIEEMIQYKKDLQWLADSFDLSHNITNDNDGGIDISISSKSFESFLGFLSKIDTKKDFKIIRLEVIPAPNLIKATIKIKPYVLK